MSDQQKQFDPLTGLEHSKLVKLQTSLVGSFSKWVKVIESVNEPIDKISMKAKFYDARLDVLTCLTQLVDFAGIYNE